MTGESKTFAALEMLCVFFWFLLDGFWLMEWHELTYAFSVLAVGTGIAMFFFVVRQLPVILVACADFSWLLTNILWSVGDLSHVKPAADARRCVGFSPASYSSAVQTVKWPADRKFSGG